MKNLYFCFLQRYYTSIKKTMAFYIIYYNFMQNNSCYPRRPPHIPIEEVFQVQDLGNISGRTTDGAVAEAHKGSCPLH